MDAVLGEFILMSMPLQVDLIIATAGLRSIGHLRDPVNLLSCVGNDPYRDESIATELQLYGLPGSDLVVLQQRAPAAIGRCAPARAAPCMRTMCVSCPATSDVYWRGCRQAAYTSCLAEFLHAKGIQRVGCMLAQGHMAVKGAKLWQAHIIALPAQVVMLGSMAAELPNLQRPDAPELLCMSSAAALPLPGNPWRQLQV